MAKSINAQLTVKQYQLGVDVDYPRAYANVGSPVAGHEPVLDGKIQSTEIGIMWDRDGIAGVRSGLQDTLRNIATHTRVKDGIIMGMFCKISESATTSETKFTPAVKTQIINEMRDQLDNLDVLTLAQIAFQTTAQTPADNEALVESVLSIVGAMTSSFRPTDPKECFIPSALYQYMSMRDYITGGTQSETLLDNLARKLSKISVLLTPDNTLPAGDVFTIKVVAMDYLKNFYGVEPMEFKSGTSEDGLRRFIVYAMSVGKKFTIGNSKQEQKAVVFGDITYASANSSSFSLGTQSKSDDNGTNKLVLEIRRKKVRELAEKKKLLEEEKSEILKVKEGDRTQEQTTQLERIDLIVKEHEEEIANLSKEFNIDKKS